MSVRALDIINECLLALGDPAGKRVTITEALTFLNEVSRDVARKLKCKEYVSLFDLADEDAYYYPDDMIVLSSLWFSEDGTGYRKLKELQKAEFEMSTNGAYATGSPYAYYPRANFFHLYPMPDREFIAGGRLEYFGLPDAVTSDLDTIKLADYMRDTIRNGMEVRVLEKLEEVEKGSYQQWVASIADDREDRTRDRRPRIQIDADWHGRGAV